MLWLMATAVAVSGNCVSAPAVQSVDVICLLSRTQSKTTKQDASFVQLIVCYVYCQSQSVLYYQFVLA